MRPTGLDGRPARHRIELIASHGFVRVQLITIVFSPTTSASLSLRVSLFYSEAVLETGSGKPTRRLVE